MSGMGGTMTQSLSYPTLAFAFGLVLAGYSVWDLDQLSGGRYGLASATSAVASPALAGVPAGSSATVLSSAGAASVGSAGVSLSRAGRGNRAVGRRLLLSAGTAEACRVAMGVTMAFMLFIMI
jgi:hypothetical protein